MQLNRSQRFFCFLISSCLVFFLSACGSGGSNTSTTSARPGNTPVSNNTTTPGTTQPGSGITTAPFLSTQTSCPPAGTGRAAAMPPLALGKHSNIVYTVNEFQGQTPTFGTLKRLDIITDTKTEIVKIAGITISDAQISADGQWILFDSRFQWSLPGLCLEQCRMV